MSLPLMVRALLRTGGLATLLMLAVILSPGRGEAGSAITFQSSTGEIFELQCAPCHGVEGEGGVGPSLRTSTMTDAELLQIIRDGSSTMPAFGPTLTGAQIDALVALSASLQEPAAPPGQTPVQRGAQVYTDNCANCHGADAAGGAGPTLRTSSATGDSMEMIIKQGLGSMPGYDGRLEPDEISAVMVFLRELADAGGQPPADGDSDPVALGASLFTRNCSSCHGPDAGGGAGPALKNTSLTEPEILIVMLNGQGAMPRFSSILSNEDASALVAYLVAARESDDGPGALPNTATAGEEIFRSTCATCHGPDGGGGLGPALAGTRLTTNELISQVFGGHPAGMPAFEGVLDPVQVRDVSRYISSLQSEPGSDPNWAAWVITVGLVAAGVFAFWYSGTLDRLTSRLRRLLSRG